MTAHTGHFVSSFGRILIVMAVASLLLAGCDDQQGPVDEPAQETATRQSTPMAAQVGNLATRDLGRVCRAAIGALFFRDPAIIGVDRFDAGIVYVSYNRPSDGSFWEFRCRQQGERVVWSTVNADGPRTGFGRWRDDPSDEAVTFQLVGATGITITQRLGTRLVATGTFEVP